MRYGVWDFQLGPIPRPDLDPTSSPVNCPEDGGASRPKPSGIFRLRRGAPLRARDPSAVPVINVAGIRSKSRVRRHGWRSCQLGRCRALRRRVQRIEHGILRTFSTAGETRTFITGGPRGASARRSSAAGRTRDISPFPREGRASRPLLILHHNHVVQRGAPLKCTT